MRRDVIISISFHLLVIIAIILFGPNIQPVKGYPKIYRVGLVSLPAPAGGSGEGGKTEVSGKAEKASEKGIAIKELKNSKEKKSISEKEQNAKKENLGKNKTGSSKEQPKKERMPGGTTAGSSSGISGGIVGSAQVDGADFGGDYYVQMFVAKINDLWENPIKSASSTLNAIVYFRILKDGDVVDVKIEKSSGVGVFDKAALRAVISVSPLQPLPNEYTGEYLGVHLEFEFVQ
ncbi:MAG TPA: cell envelope integrity protein TolA [candidate division Zixibacteria bacterium]